MSRLLLLNFEDFGLNQDITKTIQSFNPFCICCLDREGPMLELEKCEHSDYLDAFHKSQLKQFNQLVCLQCHSILMKIKYFQKQVVESYEILLSGMYTNTTVNKERINRLIIQKVVDDLHLPPDPETQINITDGNNSMEENYNVIEIQNGLNLEESFTGEIPNMANEDLIHDQNRLNIEVNKNIKTALEILERNNQSFVTLGSQLQFLNGEHLSFLEPSLLSKEILTDLPLVPAKNLTDLDNGLLNNSKTLDIEIDGPDKMFYDSLDLSPELVGKETNASEISEIKLDSIHPPLIHNDVKPKTIRKIMNPKKAKKGKKSKNPLIIRRIKLSQDELNRERLLQAQSGAYLRYKFRCVTCVIGFNYKDNLDDHIKRKHGPRVGDGVICDICSQVIPNPGSMTEHNYRHYTRYECVLCNKRYQSYDETIRHCARNQCGTSSTVHSPKTRQKNSQPGRAKM